MRDLFEDIFARAPIDPVEAARRALRPPLRRRFYGKVEVGATAEGFAVLLDGRPVRTPARRTLAAPTPALAEALAAEWQAQTETIDPATMPLTRLANTILDGVAVAPGPVAAEIAKYLASDLLFYRSERPPGLLARQAAAWDPVLAWAHDALGARFVVGAGVSHVPQPEAALAAARAMLPADPWHLGALHTVTTLTGSALLALALAARRLSVAEAWAVAHVDEDWNLEQWGRDEIALRIRDFRFAEMQAAAQVLALVPA
jgi:chaperone required for assembly of F1-ATPase